MPSVKTSSSPLPNELLRLNWLELIIDARDNRLINAALALD